MSCTNVCASNEIEYKGNGSQVLYTFPYTYLKPTDIYVDIYDETTRRWARAEAPYTWTFANATTIEFAQAPPTPTETEVFNIKIARCTDIDPLIAQFNPGPAIRAVDLNNNFEQLQLAIQEGRCQVPEWLYDYLTSEYWNKFEDTTFTTDVWVDESDDEHVPTTGAVNQELVERWDKRTETTYTTDTWTNSTNDGHVPTTGATNQELVQRWDKRTETIYSTDEWVGNDTDVASTKAIDDHLNNYVPKTYIEPKVAQTTGNAEINDEKVFSTAAASARFDTYSQEIKPADVVYEQPAKGWFDTNTLLNYSWDSQADCWVSMANAGPPGPPGPVGAGEFIAPLVESESIVSIDLNSLNRIL